MGNIEKQVKALAVELGFDLVGITSAETFEHHRITTLQRIKRGFMDGLGWFTEDRVNRGTVPENLLPGAKSIISVGLSYYVSADSVKDVSSSGKVARYAWGDDYHKLMKDRLKEYVNVLSTRCERKIEARWYVDDGPMLDRAAAERAGLGWYGKNTNILTRSHGSWVFLGQVVTDMVLEPDKQLKKTCGNCVRCIDSCPTGALLSPYVLDNKRCISFLTIENRGVIPRELRTKMFDWVFGCDICQDICPVNVKAMYSKEQAFQKKRFTTLELVGILGMTEEEFQERFSNSPIKRAKLVGLKRNACVALGNNGDRKAVPDLIETLEVSTTLIKIHAAWALGRLGGSKAECALSTALNVEADEELRSEILMALKDLSGYRLKTCS